MIKSLVLGAGGFIGNHLVSRLKQNGHFVKGIDLKHPEFSETSADEFIIGDLRDPRICAEHVTSEFDEVYQLLPIWVVPVTFSLERMILT